MNIRIPEQNQVLLSGRLTHDPDIRYTQKGLAVCAFDMAANRRYKDKTTGEWKDDATFVPVVVWAPMAERCKEKLKKGSPVHVEGRLASSEYTDKNGQKRKTLKVVARRIQFLAVASVASSGAQEAPAEPSASGERHPEPSAPASGGHSHGDETQTDEMEEVPF
ncbi:MAG: single-stranded DNA-binding protein [Elusimicrobia bacterium]|nr:single-stranded DNA-binding protein [Elusimicrobiota bacterium]